MSDILLSRLVLNIIYIMYVPAQCVYDFNFVGVWRHIMYGQRDWGMGGGVVRVEMSVWLSVYESEEKTNEKAWGIKPHNPHSGPASAFVGLG